MATLALLGGCSEQPPAKPATQKTAEKQQSDYALAVDREAAKLKAFREFQKGFRGEN